MNSYVHLGELRAAELLEQAQLARIAKQFQVNQVKPRQAQRPALSLRALLLKLRLA